MRKLMWKKVCCAAVVCVSRQVEELRSVKAAFFRGQRRETSLGRTRRGHMTWREGGPCAFSRPSNCSWGDAVHLTEAACVRKCSGGGRPGTWHALWSVQPGKKPARCPWTGGAHSLSSTLQCWPLTLPQSVSAAPSLVSFFCRFYLFFFNLIFPSLPLPRPPSHPSPNLLIHLLSSQHTRACYCFSFSFGRLLFTNGLLPTDQYFTLCCINYWRSREEGNTKGHNLTLSSLPDTSSSHRCWQCVRHDD